MIPLLIHFTVSFCIASELFADCIDFPCAYAWGRNKTESGFQGIYPRN